MLAASFLSSSFLQTISAMALWSVHAEKVPQASRQLISDGNQKILGHDRKPSLLFLVHVSITLNLQKNVHAFETDTKGRTLCCHLRKLGD